MQITYKDVEIGAPDDVGLETFKKGAILQEEEQKHAEPDAQWAALTKCIRMGATISHTAAVMREICDAVDHEVTKEVRRALPIDRCCAAHRSPQHAWRCPGRSCVGCMGSKGALVLSSVQELLEQASHVCSGYVERRLLLARGSVHAESAPDRAGGSDVQPGTSR